MSMDHSESIAATMPQEMIDAIAGQLYADEDWHTLGLFGLVQRTWLPSSRRYLFSDVSLNSSNVDAFLKILTAPNCIMAPYVCRLELKQDHGKLLNKFLPYGQPLSAVKALLIQELRWEDLIPEAEETLLSGFDGITHLELHQPKFDSFGQFVSFVTNFSSLELLSLIRGDWDEDYGASSSQISTKSVSTKLRTLKASVFSPCKCELVKWLVRCQPVPAISTVELHGVTKDEAPMIGSFMKALGPALQHLRLGFNIDITTVNLIHTFDLAQNTQLRSISLNSCGPIHLSGSKNFASCFPSILATSSSHSIEEINICLEHPVLEALEFREWNTMALLFDAPQFSGLKKFHFLVCGLKGVDEIALETSIKERLGQCASRGILSVKTGKSRAHPLLDGMLLQYDDWVI